MLLVSVHFLLNSIEFMEFHEWATPGENRKLFGKAKANGADDLILSDFDATIGFLEGKAGK
jgi:hypothetical protein